MTSLSLKIATDRQQLLGLEDDWNRLNTDPLHSFVWHSSWWNEFGAGKSLRVYSLHDNDQIVGIAPFFVDRWLGQNRLRFLGSGNTCTDYAQLIVKAEYRAEFEKQIVDDLVASNQITMIELEGVLAEQVQSFQDILLDSSFWQYEGQLEPTWVIELPDTWESFKQQAKKSLRRKINKAEKRLNSDSFQVDVCGSDEFEPAFDTLVELHQDRFTKQGEPGVFSDSRFYGFLHRATRKLVAENRAEIIIGRQDGQPIIAQLYLLGEDGPQLYQAGIRTAAMKSEPGHLLFTFAVRRAIEQGHPVFDFLRGNEAYKPYWGARPRQLSKLRLVSSDWYPTTVNRVYQVARGIKNLLKPTPAD